LLHQAGVIIYYYTELFGELSKSPLKVYILFKSNKELGKRTISNFTPVRSSIRPSVSVSAWKKSSASGLGFNEICL